MTAPAAPRPPPAGPRRAAAARAPAPATRRALLGGAAAAAAALAAGPRPPPASARPSIADRIREPGVVKNVGYLGLVPKEKELLFPGWMEGEWEATSTLRGFRAPLGPSFAPPDMAAAAKRPAEEGGEGSTVGYRLRFRRDAPRGGLLGPRGEGPVVSDRRFNGRSAFNARALKFNGFGPVEYVDYDERTPDRLTLVFKTVGPDMRQLPQRKIELYVNGRSSESARDAEGREVFRASELYRQVFVGPRTVEATDYEVLWEYTRLGDGRVRGRQRTVFYLQPQEPRYFDAAGGSIGVYDYDVDLERVG